MSDKNILFDNFSASDLKELLTDIKYKSPADMGTMVPYNKFQKGGGCQYSDYSYPDDFRYDSEYVSTHNSINNTLRALLYNKTMKPLTYQQQTGAGYKTLSSVNNNINLNFTGVPNSVQLSDIDFDSPRLYNYLNSQEGGGVVSYLKYYFGLRKRKIAFKSFIPRFEKVRTDLEKLVKTFETESEVYKKRADRNAELVHDYYVAQKYGVILTILKDHEAEQLEDFKIKKVENHEADANKIWFYKYRIKSSAQVSKDMSIIDKYIKFNEIRIKEFKNNLESSKKIMYRDLKKEKKMLGLLRGANYFDRLKKTLAKNYNDMASLMNKRNEFTKDMEEARNAIALYADLSKSDEAELLPERKKMLVLYEKNKEYYENLLKYTPEKLQPLFEVLEKKSVLFARIENYKMQYFGFNVETLVTEFNKWRTDMIEGYKLLKIINTKSNELEKAIGKSADDIAYNINSLKVIQSKEIQDMINDFVIVNKTLNLCESMQSAITSTSASVLNNIGKMVPLNNMMKDMFNIKLAQSMVQHKMQYIYNELNMKYSAAAFSDYLTRQVANIRTGGALMLAPKPNFYNLIKKTKTTHANKYKKKTNKILTIGGKRNKKYNYSTLKGGAPSLICQNPNPTKSNFKLIDTLITYPTNFTYRNDLGVLTNIKLQNTGGSSYVSSNSFIMFNSASNVDITQYNNIIGHPQTTSNINIDTKHNHNNANITINLTAPPLTITHAGTGTPHTQFRHNMFLDTIPNGFRLPNWKHNNFIKHIKKINTDLIAIKDKYCVLFDHDDDKIYIIKNNILDKDIDINSIDTYPGFKNLSGDLYYYNPIFKHNNRTNLTSIKNAMSCLFYSIELKTHETPDTSKTKTKLVTFLPLFVQSNYHNTANDLIQYNDYYLVNPFSDEYELYLTVAKKKEIDKRKHNNNMFYFKEGDKNRIALEYYLYNDANYNNISSTINNGVDIKDDTYYLFTYNVNYLDYKYHDKLKNNYIYFNPGYPGFIDKYNDTNKTYGIYTNSASALDSNFTAATMNDKISEDKGTKNFNKVEGVPPHHAVLDIGTHIHSDKSNKFIKNIINYTTMQSMFFNNILFYLSGAINTSGSTINESDKILTKFHTDLPGGTGDRYNKIEYSYIAERKFINNYYINADYDVKLFENIVNDGSTFDVLKQRYDNTNKIIQISNCIPNFLDSSATYTKTDVEYVINSVAFSTIFIKHSGGAGAPATGTTAPATGATGAPAATPTLNIGQTATYTHIMNQLTDTQVLTRINNIQNTTNMFTPGNTNNIFGKHMSVFNKCMNYFNNNLKREREFINIPRKVKTPKDFLTGFTYITDKLEVKISDDKNKAVTPEGEGLENLIRENRALIDNVGDVINLTPSNVINDSSMQQVMSRILEWSATQGSGPQRYYGKFYNTKFDKFFINKDNVDNFINEMKQKYSRDPNTDVKIGKFFHFLPTFMTINLNKFSDVMDIIRPYIKLYTESLKPKDKTGKVITKPGTTPATGIPRVPVVQTPQQP